MANRNFFDYFSSGFFPAYEQSGQRFMSERAAKEQAEREAAQNKLKNRIAILQAVGGLNTTDEQKNALLAALDPGFLQSREVSERVNMPITQPATVLPAQTLPTAVPRGYSPRGIPRTEADSGIGVLPTAPRGSFLAKEQTIRPAEGFTKRRTVTSPMQVFQAKPEKPAPPATLSAQGTFMSSLFKSGLSPEDQSKIAKEKLGINLDASAIKNMQESEQIRENLKQQLIQSQIDLNKARERYAGKTAGSRPPAGQMVKYGQLFSRQRDGLIKSNQALQKNINELRSSLSFYGDDENLSDSDRKAKTETELQIEQAQDILDANSQQIDNLDIEIANVNEYISQAAAVEGEKIPTPTKPKTKIPEDLSQASIEQLLKIMSGQ